MIEEITRHAILEVAMDGLDGYVFAQRQNFAAIKESPHYSSLVASVDSLYRMAIDTASPHCPRVCFGQMLLMCHKSLLSAATLIAQGQPDDAALVTRRAIEIGHLAVAVHLDPASYEKWLDAARRHARWQERLKGQKPKSEPSHKWGKDVLSHPLLTELRGMLGIISDSYAHFTPEFQGNLQWKDRTESEQPEIELQYFDTTKRTIHCAFLNLVAAHLKLLEIFNACFGGGLHGDTGWHDLNSAAWKQGYELGLEFRGRDGEQK